MKISEMRTQPDGTRSYEIRATTISFGGLLHHIRRIPGAVIKKARRHYLTDDTEIVVEYKDVIITIDAPFSDYFVSCASSSAAFDEFISILRSRKVKWWQYIL